MLDAVFISDLHLHPDEDAIMLRFQAFIDWVGKNTRTLYILGDFFHVWPGDDGLNQWSRDIAQCLRGLAEQGVSIFFMHGNRDFLLGRSFASLAGMTILPEPTVINLNDEPILLTHGDRYCLEDVAHQRFRKLTRNKLFYNVFLHLPFAFRNKIVNQVRQRSQANRNKTAQQMDVVVPCVLEHMQSTGVRTVIHGHTHKPGLSKYTHDNEIFSRFVLSDWDDRPKILCYDKSKGFQFIQCV